MPRRLKPTLEELRENMQAAKDKFGADARMGYACVSTTQFSIARYYGGCKIDGKSYIYNEADDSLIREDVSKWLVQQRKNDAKTD